MTKWIYSVDGKEFGPVSEREIVSLLLHDKLELESYIMSDAKPIWVKLNTVQSIMDKVHIPDVHINFDDDGLAEFVEMDNNDSAPLFCPMPIPRMVMMALLTGGLYQLYWFYMQGSWLRWHTNSKDRSHQWSISFLLFPWRILGEIANNRELNRIQPCNFSAFWLATGWVLLPYVNILCLIPVQMHINEVNEKKKRTAASSVKA
ncbi:MAG: hypothetical protein RBS43_08050 [Candidatus Cloacimonas sp.]|jgi:hypothetical protein|nr:hypothetical protein [Candidatus Cloacimonas sp.]